jgi:hypothetical protein
MGKGGVTQFRRFGHNADRLLKRASLPGGAPGALGTLWIGSERVATRRHRLRHVRRGGLWHIRAVNRQRKELTGWARPETTGRTGKFATSKRDGTTELAYADQRYYQPGEGRLMTRTHIWLRVG